MVFCYTLEVCLVIIFLNVNINISHNYDWTMFGRMLNYSLKIV